MNMKFPNDDSMYSGYSSDEDIVFIPPPIRDGDFSEYMWMENEEEFDTQVIKQLEEEELVEQCLEAMLESEDATDNVTESMASVHLSNGALSGVRNGNANLANGDGRRSKRSASARLERIAQGLLPYDFSDDDQRQDSNIRSRQNGFCENTSVLHCNGSEQSQSTLNPDAKEFIPGRGGVAGAASGGKCLQ